MTKVMAEKQMDLKEVLRGAGLAGGTVGGLQLCKRGFCSEG